jgi:hypothetical protein
LADIFVGFSATGDSGFLIGTGAFDVTTTSFIVDEDKVSCRPCGLTSLDRLTGQSDTAHFLHLYITFCRHDPRHAAANPTHGQTGPFSALSPLQSNRCWGQVLEWLQGKRTLAIDRASRRRNQSWPWPPTPCCRADQEPNLLKEIQLPNNEKISTNTTLSVLL